ncbi:hypothetical protein A0O34_06555 [Chryseobacterium glaciei]|uniref:Uncharacterized protein n=1 Tax=Chryseobacterium glaciei TaxID=1685010 RepID=A0A172XT67_9FLAO|nr:hypothetical protein A0O34_06555 [Chryseobacterium glaciei]
MFSKYIFLLHNNNILTYFNKLKSILKHKNYIINNQHYEIIINHQSLFKNKILLIFDSNYFHFLKLFSIKTGLISFYCEIKQY